MKAVRLYRSNRDIHFDTVFYLFNVIQGMSNKEILNMVIDDYQDQLTSNVTAISVEW